MPTILDPDQQSFKLDIALPYTRFFAAIGIKNNQRLLDVQTLLVKVNTLGISRC